MRARVSMPSRLVLNRLPVVYTDYPGVDALVVVTSRHTHSLLFSRRQALGDVAALSHPENGLHFLRVGIGVSLCAPSATSMLSHIVKPISMHLHLGVFIPETNSCAC